MNDDVTEAFELPGDATGVLLLHGFTSTPQSVRHVGHRLHQLGGFTVLAPLLAGHGETPEALARTGQLDWLTSAETALRTLRTKCPRTIVAGLSLGGTIALNLGARFPQLVDGVATINGSIGLYRPEQARSVFEPTADGFGPGIGSDICRSGVREICYERIPASTLEQRFVLTMATGLMLPCLIRPVLVMQSRIDHVVDPASGPCIVQRVGSTLIELRWLERSWHVATLDHDRDLIVDYLVGFITRIAASSTA